MRNKQLWIGILLVVVIAMLGYAWFSTYERKWYDRRVPVQGEADYNEYYVLQQALRAQGVGVQSLPHLPPGIEHWGNHDTLLLGSDPKTLAAGQIDAILDWVGRGGRLLVASESLGEQSDVPLLDRLGVVPAHDMWCLKLQSIRKDPWPECFRTFGISPSARAQFAFVVGSDQHGLIAARRPWGQGEVEIVGDFGRMRNQELAAEPSGDWTWQLVAPMLHGGVFHIVYQTELPPLYTYLIRYGWFALLPLLLALFAWLWARSQRFGPLLPLPAPDRRALGEHIQASGEYLFRRGLTASLYAPLRRLFDDQLRRRDPELAVLPQASIAQALALRHRLPVEKVLQALRTPQPKPQKVFLSTIQTLLYLLRHP